MQPLSFCVLIRCGPHHQSQAHNACAFTEALLCAGHSLDRVFFYQQGVLTASNFSVPNQDDLHLCKQWQKLQQQHNLQLDVCIAAALKYGIVNDEEAQRYGLKGANLADGFVLAGLGQLATALLRCDRVITFGNTL